MPRILVIADDLSGAAEIAGIGLRYGLSAMLVRDDALPDEESDVLVVDADSRLLPAQQAGVKVSQALGRFRKEDFRLIYKKIDSVLRGPVLGEVEAALLATKRSAALLVPANPSGGRTIRGGEYRVRGVPLNQTTFADDPEYPAQTANVLELIGASTRFECRIATPASGRIMSGMITVGDAESAEDVRRWAECIGDDALAVGGADFFAALLEQDGLSVRSAGQKQRIEGRALFVCGSASKPSQQVVQRAMESGVCVCGMMEDLNLWEREIAQRLNEQQRAIIAILKPAVSDRAQSRIFCDKLSEIVQHVLAARYGVAELLVEGGATASAIARRMGWNKFLARDEIAPGVVRLAIVADGAPPLVTIKPGSYPWPPEIWNASSTQISR